MQFGHAEVNSHLEDVGPLFEPRHPKRGPLPAADLVQGCHPTVQGYQP